MPGRTLSTMVRSNAYINTGNNCIQRHHGRKFRIETFDSSAIISYSWNLLRKCQENLTTDCFEKIWVPIFSKFWE